MFHTLVAPIEANGQLHVAKITLREAPHSPDPTHKFYDVAAIEIEKENTPNVYSLRGNRSDSPLPTPDGAFEIGVGDLVSAIKG
jgi:hypothetical protein